MAPLFRFSLFHDYAILRAMINEIMPLDQVLRKRADMSPRATFVKFEGKKFSYKEMDRLATVFATELTGAA